VCGQRLCLSRGENRGVVAEFIASHVRQIQLPRELGVDPDIGAQRYPHVGIGQRRDPLLTVAISQEEKAGPDT